MKAVIIPLLVIAIFILLDISESIEKGNLSPGDKAEIVSQEKHEKELSVQREARIKTIKETRWSDVHNNEDRILKAINTKSFGYIARGLGALILVYVLWIFATKHYGRMRGR